MRLVVLDGGLLAHAGARGGDRLLGMLALPAVRGLDLELGRVAEHDLGEVDGAVRGMDRSAVALLHELGDAAAVVEMGVGEEERVNGPRLVGERQPVAGDLFRAALEHPAVDEDASVTDGHEELRAGDGTDRPQELDLDAHGPMMRQGVCRRRPMIPACPSPSIRPSSRCSPSRPRRSPTRRAGSSSRSGTASAPSSSGTVASCSSNPATSSR